MNNMLEDFLDHKLLINIKDATTEDLKELDSVIGLPYTDGDKIYKHELVKFDRYLHCRVRTDPKTYCGLSYSETPCDVFKNNQPINSVSFDVFIENVCMKNIHNISETEIEELFGV